MSIQTDGQAPYAPPKAVLHVITGYRERGLQTPFTVDVLKRAGVTEALAPRTLQTFKLLDLIGDGGEPTETFVALRKAPHDEFQQRLGAVLKASYAEVFSYIDPAQDSPDRIRDAFRSYKPHGQQERMVTLFLGLCEAAGIITEKLPKRVGKRTPRPAVRVPRTVDASSETPTAPDTVRTDPASPALIDTLFQVKSQQQAPGGHPIIQGLLRELPPIKSKWPRSDYERWLATQSAAFNLLYEIEDKD